MKSKARILFVVAAVLVVTTVAAQSVWEREVNAQIDEASYQFRQEGFHKLGETWIGELEEGDDDYVTVELDSDYEYIAIAVCDSDCGDIDLVLYNDDDVRIANDIGTDDIPVLTGTPDYDGEYYLEAVIADCDADTCAFGVALYAR